MKIATVLLLLVVLVAGAFAQRDLAPAPAPARAAARAAPAPARAAPAPAPTAAAAVKTATCSKATEPDIAALFTKWNDALKTQDPDKVVDLYAENSVLLPTLSNKPRTTPEMKRDYFVEFLAKKPVGTILTRTIFINCETAMDVGTYSFTVTDKKTGEKSQVPARYSYTYDISSADPADWKITSHHSSAMPEKTEPESA